jgi:hypothetical protein
MLAVAAAEGEQKWALLLARLSHSLLSKMARPALQIEQACQTQT